MPLDLLIRIEHYWKPTINRGLFRISLSKQAKQERLVLLQNLRTHNLANFDIQQYLKQYA